jgi:hypothetical protein
MINTEIIILLNTHKILCDEFINEFKKDLTSILKQDYNKTADIETDNVIKTKAIHLYVKTLITKKSHIDSGLSRYLFDFLKTNCNTI